MKQATDLSQSLAALTAPDFIIRRAGEGDRHHLLPLLEQMLGGDAAARYEWLYQANPHGQALTWLAYEKAGGAAVACTSMFPRKVIIRGEERLGSIGGDCFVEPRVRRRGLATALHRVSFVEMQEAGVAFMYGPPVVENLSALVKAGSQVVTDYKRWIRLLATDGAYQAAITRTPSRVEARLGNLSIQVLDHLTRAKASEFILEPATEIGAEFDDWFTEASRTHEIVCQRDSRYLRWRYQQAPSGKQKPLALRREGRLEGFVALELAGDHGAIVDLFTACEPQMMDAALQLAIEYATDRGCRSLEISLTKKSRLAGRLLRLGFIGRDERGFQVALVANDGQAACLLNPLAWHFTEADQDLDTCFPSHV